MHDLASCFVLGYHGCSWQVARRLLLRQDVFRRSENDYDWLGHGIYFWLENPKRACEWAKRQIASRDQGGRPAVVGAVIDLGNCLDLTTEAGIEAIQAGYEALRAIHARQGLPLPENASAGPNDQDRLIRRLDCAVINMTCKLLESEGMPVDTVKGMFTEGGPAYEGGGIMRHTHTQIAVRNPACIRGIFLPSARELMDRECNASVQV
jgi:hypothetical protein